MSFPSAAFFLYVNGYKNRVRRSLKQPRYLIFTACAVVYFWSVLARQSTASARAVVSASASPVTVIFLGAAVLLFLLWVWVLAGDAPSLAFTETEVQFFFPAPVSRRALIHYRLVRLLVSAAFGGPFLALVTRRGGPHFVSYAVALWLGLATMSLHSVCASLTRAMLAEHGLAGLRRRAITLVVLVAYVAVAAVTCVHLGRGFPMPSALGVSDWLDAIRAWASDNERALFWVFLPIAAPYRVGTATTPGEMLAALPAAVAVLGVHYAWALSTRVAFEESEFENAARRAKRLADRRSGTRVQRRGKPAFDLRPRGATWVAIFWKNRTASSRTSPRLRILVLAVLMLAPVVPFVVGSGKPGQVASALGIVAGILAVMIAVIGPQAVTGDFRLDLSRIDILRSFPISARDVVVGELSAPLVTLSVVEWMLLVLAFLLTLPLSTGDAFGVGARAGATLVGAVVLPALTLMVLVVRNGAVLLFPAWMATQPGQERGLEAMGQRLFAMIATLVVLAIALVPAGAVGAGVAAVLWGLMGLGAVIVGVAVGGAVLWGMGWAAVWGLAAAYERFDVARG